MPVQGKKGALQGSALFLSSTSLSDESVGAQLVSTVPENGPLLATLVHCLHAFTCIRPPAGHTTANSTASTDDAGDAAGARDQQKPAHPAVDKSAAAGLTLQATGEHSDCVYEYSLNALSAALTHSSPVNMSPLVGLMEDVSKSSAYLSKVCLCLCESVALQA